MKATTQALIQTIEIISQGLNSLNYTAAEFLSQYDDNHGDTNARTIRAAKDAVFYSDQKQKFYRISSDQNLSQSAEKTLLNKAFGLLIKNDTNTSQAAAIVEQHAYHGRPDKSPALPIGLQDRMLFKAVCAALSVEVLNLAKDRMLYTLQDGSQLMLKGPIISIIDII